MQAHGREKNSLEKKYHLLSDVLQFAKERNIIIILNVKEHGIELKTLSLIEKFDMINQIYFSGRLDNVRSKDIGIQGTQLIFIPPNELTNEVIDFIHERHKHVGTSLFNTDNRDRIKEGMVEGVDVILTRLSKYCSRHPPLQD